MNVVYLALGSNKGNKQDTLNKAEALITDRIGEISISSTCYTTDPVGFISAHKFLNKVICVHSFLEAKDILFEISCIEEELGRTTKSTLGGYEDRTIDIDILYYNNAIIDTEDLIIPHPRMHTRLFVLHPLAEIAPNVIHPIFQLSTKEMLRKVEKTIE
jgi:2-amino-4-hydroxy-6-hydroxymethyldihydropteridine diphosphokinase